MIAIVIYIHIYSNPASARRSSRPQGPRADPQGDDYLSIYERYIHISIYLYMYLYIYIFISIFIYIYVSVCVYIVIYNIVIYL